MYDFLLSAIVTIGLSSLSRNLVLIGHKLVLNHTQGLCLILTTQAYVALTQDQVFCNTKHEIVLQGSQVSCCFLHKIILFLQDDTVFKMSVPSPPFTLFTVPPIPVQSAYMQESNESSGWAGNQTGRQNLIQPENGVLHYERHISRGKGSDKIEVIDIGLNSLGLAGWEILGIITAAFHCRGTTPSASDWLTSQPDAETM